MWELSVIWQDHSESHQSIVMTVDMKTLSRLLLEQTRGAPSVFIPPQSLGLVCQLNTCQFCLDQALMANLRLYLSGSFIQISNLLWISRIVHLVYISTFFINNQNELFKIALEIFDLIYFSSHLGNMSPGVSLSPRTWTRTWRVIRVIIIIFWITEKPSLIPITIIFSSSSFT